MAPRWISHKTQDHEPRHAYVFPHLIPRKTNISIYSCMHANILKILQWSSLNKSSSEKEDARRQYIPKLAARQMFADPEPYFVSTTFKRKNFHQYKDTSAGAEPASCLAACVEMQRLSLTHWAFSTTNGRVGYKSHDEQPPSTCWTDNWGRMRYGGEAIRNTLLEAEEERWSSGFGLKIYPSGNGMIQAWKGQNGQSFAHIYHTMVGVGRDLCRSSSPTLLWRYSRPAWTRASTAYRR